MPQFLIAVLVITAGVVSTRDASAQALPAAAPGIDYASDEAWLCRPGRPAGTDACRVDLSTTIVAADGRLSREAFTPNPSAPVDCFYVYPTVSPDRGEYSDLQPTAELNVVALIGHSQGAFVLARLIREEIEGRPVQARLVSAILLGATVTVPKGRDVGGSFTSIAVCRSASQVGCVIAYASFRATLPPAANTLFGRVDDPALEAICVNPAELMGSPAAELHAYLSATGTTITGGRSPRAWVMPERRIETPYVSVPGLLTARCASNEHARYLEITVHGDRSDPRTDDISGDLGNPPNASWGLHLVDMNLAIGNLLDVVRRQADAHGRRSVPIP